MRTVALDVTQKQKHVERITETSDYSNHIHTPEHKSSRKIMYLQTDTVNKCLTDDCKDCTGSYTNDLLHHRLVCACECHNKKQKGLGSVEGPAANALDLIQPPEEENPR
jgi:hypothetical protein